MIGTWLFTNGDIVGLEVRVVTDDLTWPLRILLVRQIDDVSFAILGLDLLSRRFRVLGPYADTSAGLVANPDDAFIELHLVAFASRLFHRVILCNRIVHRQGKLLRQRLDDLSSSHAKNVLAACILTRCDAFRA